MRWTIKVWPISPEQDTWDWTAERADGENLLRGINLPTKEEALAAARAGADEFEAGQGVIVDASFEEVYTPVGVVIPEPPAEEV